jgi:23S rRNA pseudouridine2604 synthase
MPHDLESPSSREPVRLSKRVAAQLPCSRSEAERFIECGLVRVNGRVVDSPQSRVSPDQQVTVDTQTKPGSLEPITLLFHRVAGGAATPQAQNRWPEDRSGVQLLQIHLRNLAPLLPLPTPATGLAVFSQDGRIIRKLSEDALSIEQELVVEVSGQIAEGGLARLAQGLFWRNQPLPPVKVSWQSERRLRFALKGVEPAQVPWMCEQVGLRVTQMRRLRIGRLSLASLPPGQWRYLLPYERF